MMNANTNNTSMNTANTNAMNNKSNIRYIILESDIPYDWDDYDLWGAVLYDIKNHNITTTKYGHGCDMNLMDLREEPGEGCTLTEALEAGIIDIDTILRDIINVIPINIDEALVNTAYCASLDYPIAIPVTVTRGRKFKGDGYLIYAISEKAKYGWGAYHDEYNYYPMIVNPKDGTINKVNAFGYCKFDINEADVRNKIFENTPHTIAKIKEFAHWWAYNMSFSHCDSVTAYRMSTQIAERGLDFDNIPDVVNDAINAEKIRLANAAEAKMNEKLPKIIEWVKTHTDKTNEDDILELAKHIYHKYND